MNHSHNKFNMMAAGEINSGLNLGDFIALTYSVDGGVRVTIPDVGSKLKLKSGKKIVLKKISRGTKNGENRLTLHDFRSVYSIVNTDLMIFFGKEPVMSARIDPDRIVLVM